MVVDIIILPSLSNFPFFKLSQFISWLLLKLLLLVLLLLILLLQLVLVHIGRILLNWWQVVWVLLNWRQVVWILLLKRSWLLPGVNFASSFECIWHLGIGHLLNSLRSLVRRVGAVRGLFVGHHGASILEV